MNTSKLQAGSAFPTIQVPDANGVQRDIAKPLGEADWMMVVVYRGRHCPMCTRYLNALESFKTQLRELGIDLAAVSADSQEQLEEHSQRLDVTFPLYHSLSLEQMKRLGLYISHPRSANETDHPFPEPGLFVVNDQGQLQVVDLSNNPFVRPEIETLLSGLKWIRDPDNHYPIRGTHAYE